MGDHDDNHNHGHKKRGEILHLEKIITKKERTNKYHKDQDKYWKARTRTKMTRTWTSRKMTRGRTRRKMEKTRDLMLSGKPGRFSANNSLLPAFSPFSQYLGNKYKKYIK